MNNTSINIQPVGYVRGGRVEATKDNWGSNQSVIVLRDDLFTAEATEGLALQSHVEVLFHFHLHSDEPQETGTRHPRGRADWPKVGIFAQRGRMRMNRIGVSICRLVRVSGLELEVTSLDAVDGTPVIDIKPVWSGYLPRGEFREPAWSSEIMREYW